MTVKLKHTAQSTVQRLISINSRRSLAVNKKPNDISDEITNTALEYSSFQVVHKFPVAPALRNKTQGDLRLGHLYQIASLQNHFNFLCVALHPDRGGEL